MYDGELVRLRTYEPDDLDALLRWVNDPALRPYLARRYPFSRAVEAEWIERCREPRYGDAHFVIEARDSGRAIGTVALRGAEPENRCANFGIQIGEADYRDRGYGTDATRTACRFGFDEMGLHRIELWVLASNERAIAAYRKVGFVEEARAREGTWKAGNWHDMVCLGLLAHELR